jgi:hypothetical protein
MNYLRKKERKKWEKNAHSLPIDYRRGSRD